MNNQDFKGDKKLPLKSPLAKLERQFIDANVAKFPSSIETYHLTLMTIPWSVGMIAFGYLAKNNLHWLWLSSLMLFLQWYTDCFDGAIGRYRDTGLAKWGFYMDHFLDYVFMSSVFIGYAFLFQGLNQILMFCMAPLYCCLMVSSFLAFGATSEFKITYLGVGPTEIRLFFILLNTAIIFFKTTFLEKSLLYIFMFFIAGLCVVIYRTQKYIWDIDMKNKKDTSTSVVGSI